MKKNHILVSFFFLIQFSLFCQDGSLDLGFGNNGKVLTSIASSPTSSATDIKVQDDGKIIVAGISVIGQIVKFLVLRYEANGSLDNSFGNSGIVTTAFGQDSDYAMSLAIQNDGKIIVAGYSYYDYSNYLYSEFALVRYNSDGSLDNSFGNSGKLTIAPTLGTNECHDIVIQDDGKIVLFGHSYNIGFGDGNSFTTIRLNTDGSLDNGFGTNGMVKTDIGIYDSSGSISIQTDGKIVVAGYSGSAGMEHASLVRYNIDGSIDNSFGNNGLIITPIANKALKIKSLAIQNDGKILTGGYSYFNQESDFFVMRYNLNGEIDNGFGLGGIVNIDFSNSVDACTSLEIQNDGKILLAGYTGDDVIEQSADFGSVRINLNGTLDESYGSNGVLITDIGTLNDLAHACVIQSDGKILLAGNSYNGSISSVAVARFENSSNSLSSNEILEIDKNIFDLHPNPLSIESNIFTDSILDNVTLRLYNSTGELINETYYESGDSFKIDGHNLENGTYHIQLLQKGSIVFKESIVKAE